MRSPADSPDAAGAVQPLAAAGGDGGATPTILLVDDDERLGRAYARQLRQAGFEVVLATGGAEALEICRAHAPTAVISDISLPGMDGLEILRRVRAIDPDCPVLLMTGDPGVGSAIDAVHLGALRYMVKPVPPEELVAHTQEAVRSRSVTGLKHRALELLDRYEREAGDRQGLSASFDRAVEQIYMFYQPIVRWSSQSVYAYEALVRSAEPALPHPGALFAAAETLGRVHDIGRAVRRMSPAPMGGSGSALLFVNLHTSELEDESIYDPGSPLAAISDRVVLEITERAALEHVKDATARIARLRELGFRIAVDDLGAGYAGLTAFAALEPDVVKLDMALVRDIHQSKTRRDLVGALVALCGAMDREVVAEGVETVEERDALLALGCDLFQGYLFAKPGMPFPQVAF